MLVCESRDAEKFVLPMEKLSLLEHPELRGPVGGVGRDEDVNDCRCDLGAIGGGLLLPDGVPICKLTIRFLSV